MAVLPQGELAVPRGVVAVGAVDVVGDRVVGVVGDRQTVLECGAGTAFQDEVLARVRSGAGFGAGCTYQEPLSCATFPGSLGGEGDGAGLSADTGAAAGHVQTPIVSTVTRSPAAMRMLRRTTAFPTVISSTLRRCGVMAVACVGRMDLAPRELPCSPLFSALLQGDGDRFRCKCPEARMPGPSG